MRNEPHTFPTIRSWQRMSERQQDALLDRIETKQRRRSFASKALMFTVATAIVLGLALGVVALGQAAGLSLLP
jgi:negative regulator of sigma E activity